MATRYWKACLVILTTVSTLLTGPAFGKVMLEYRNELESKTYNDAVGKPNYYRFTVPYARLMVRSDLSEKINVQGRLNLITDATAQGNLSKRDNTNELINYMMVGYQLNPYLGLRAGKLLKAVSANEGSYSPIDQYFVSKAYESTVSNYDGVGMRYMFEDTTLDFHVANQEADSTDSSGNNQQNRGLFSLRLRQKYFDKKFTPVISYLESHPQGATPDRKNSYFGVGARYDLPDTSYFELDYLNDTFVDRGTKLGGARATDMIDSVVGRGYWVFTDKTAGVLKAESSRTQVTSSASGANLETDSKWLTWSVGVEYKPEHDTDLKLHLVYVDSTEKPTVNGVSQDDKKTQTILAGFKLFADLLK